MKLTKKVMKKTEVEVIEKEGQVLIPEFMAERELKPSDFAKINKRFFNNQGSVCILVKKIYNVEQDGKLVMNFIRKNNATKYAKKLIKEFK